MVARTWPAVTVAPGVTLTADTVPAAPKLSSSTVDEATAPEMLTLHMIVPVVAWAVTRVEAFAANGLVTQSATAAAVTTITGMATSQPPVAGPRLRGRRQGPGRR